MLEKGRHNYAVWFSRQSVEKLLKACHLVVLRSPIPRGHNLLTLGTDCFGDRLNAVRTQMTFLNPHYTIARYVDAAIGAPADVYDREFGEEAYLKAREVVEWIKAQLNLD